MIKNKRNTVGFLYVIILVLSFALLCDKFSKTNSPVIARVGRSVMTLDDLHKSIPQEYLSQITRKQKINSVKQWIDTELLYQAALNLNMHKEKEIINRLHKMKKDLLSAEMISRNSSKQNKRISEESIINYYEQHKESFIRDEDVIKYIEIVLEDMKTGWSVRNMVTQSNFIELASQYSKTPILDPNNVPFVLEKSLLPEISDVVFRIRLNGTTSPLKMGDNVHIIKVIDKQKAGDICLLEEVRDEIISTLSAQTQKRSIETLLANLRQKADYQFNFDSITKKIEKAENPEVPEANQTKTLDSTTNDLTTKEQEK